MKTAPSMTMVGLPNPANASSGARIPVSISTATPSSAATSTRKRSVANRKSTPMSVASTAHGSHINPPLLVISQSIA